VGKPDPLEPHLHAQATPTSKLPRGRSLDLHWLIGAEREYPFELPDLSELISWYVFSIGALAVAALISGCVQRMLLMAGREGQWPIAAVFWLSVLISGVVATPLGNRFAQEFVFTWPLSLFAAHQLALASLLRNVRPGDRPVAWLGPVTCGLFLIGCLVYFDCTRRLFLIPGWYFLPILALAWPLAIPAARRIVGPDRFWSSIAWTFVAFSAFFWATGGVMLWRGSSQ
jgi:hypothetical protein